MLPRSGDTNIRQSTSDGKVSGMPTEGQKPDEGGGRRRRQKQHVAGGTKHTSDRALLNEKDPCWGLGRHQPREIRFVLS